ncbi:MAG TPA: helix-turn-helix transcriptional regulator [Candidatus Nanopelagicaceae bacterium]|nr:helix-turn-helix transcriptional regulator [Candidatus Nanopelagicaceae bacterium]
MLLRTYIGEALRSRRLQQSRTLRQVSANARVSLGYLSEVERGQKEASSELLAAICTALDLSLAEIITDALVEISRQEERVASISGLVSIADAA